MNIKFRALLFISVLSCFRTSASVPQPCEGGEKEIDNMLKLLAVSAHDYYLNNGKLPSIWSKDMATIVYRVPNSDFFGNITPDYSGHKIQIACAVKKAEEKYDYFYHYIDMRNLEISHDALFQQ
jgi:hypothetical protein